ncbi:MAG: CYTH domain-containing protein [Limnohabitans sp.]|jgi:inorganic triphosphatase YgiF|uniref:CYTH domain-containing protein n=1 Tax=Limnohabitans sp. TaxID=1907725 RepID=UPI0025F1C759|nr:CYTH domain-containing protein [Limnohabitans sp.]MCO4087824.1 CYTH domain-containing protein [Limnohabitans sp.]
METELKLSLSADELARLLAHPLLTQAGNTQRLLNTYFDTPDLALQQRRMAVRERLAGEQWLLTVKTAGQSHNGLSRRQEWEGPTTPGALQFDKLVDDAALAQNLMTLRPNLRALFCTDFERQRWVIAHGGAKIEVALDQGHIHVPGTDLSEPLLELELELLSGPEEALMALADVLRQTPQGSVMLMPSDASKAQRGMALWQRT